MAKQLALRVRGLTKRYSISREQTKHSTLIETLMERARNPFRRAPKVEFSALRGIDLDVHKGDVVGIIGRNGAGKSTFLKVLSRITEPTDGEIDLYGRVGSLLEVGTGFHPELSGRENIYLNGTILGMKRKEIDREFDAIVAFAGVSGFLDTPVKRYSSGMYVRLAFAVAAHLNPEILVVDEVLAVGDADFQTKCLGKMRDVARGGRTVLFVSHNMQSVALLCNRGVYLQDGKVAYDGPVQGAIERYLNSFNASTRNDHQPDVRPGSGEYRFEWVEPGKAYYAPDEPKEVCFKLSRRKPGAARMYVAAHIVDWQGVILCQCDSRVIGTWVDDQGDVTGRLRIAGPWLKPGSYRVDVYLCVQNMGFVDRYEGAATLTVTPVLPYPFSTTEDGTTAGQVLTDFAWTLDATPQESPAELAAAGLVTK